MGAHQLHIVNQDDAQAVLGFQAAALGAHLHDGDIRRVVNIDRRFRQVADGVAYFPPVAILQEPRAQPVRVHLALRADHTGDQLLLRHLQAEDRRRQPLLHRNMLTYLDGKRRLSHGRAGRDDEQVGGLQARRHVVEVIKGRHPPGGHVLVFVALFQAVEFGIEQRAQVMEELPHTPLAHVEDQPLGPVYHVINRVVLFVGQPL